MNLSFSILHLSDLHLGRLDSDHNFEHGLPIHRGVSELATLVTSALDGHKPTFLVISGDLVCEGGHEQEHQTAVKTIHSLCHKLSINDRRRVFIVPGNHDIERGAEPSRRLSKHNELFMKAFYGGPPWPGESTHGHSIKDYIPPTKFGGNGKYVKSRWIFRFESYPVMFIPLYSADPMVDMNLPNWLTTGLKRNVNRWSFDRGLISEGQLEAVEKEMHSLRDTSALLKVVIFHHNPISLVRSGIRADDHYLAETNLLANGPEVLERLQKWGVSLVLHGHRHQSCILSPFLPEVVEGNPMYWGPYGTHQTTLHILGAPSAGLFDRSTPPPLDFIGFNLIGVQCSKHATMGTLSVYKSKPAAKLEFKPHYSNPLRFSWLKNEPVTLMTDGEGLKELGRQILSSKSGLTILHYHRSATWEEVPAPKPRGKGYITPFGKLWQPVRDQPDLLEGFSYLLPQRINIDQWKQYMHSVLTSSLKLGGYNAELLKALRGDVGNAILNALLPSSVASPDNPFLHHLQDLCREDTRSGNYALELLRLGIDQDFTVQKCIYFWSDHRANRVLKENPATWDGTKMKFRWMLDSIIACQSLSNYQLAWLPFSIADHFGQSIVVVALPPTSGVESITTTVLVGYGNPLLSQREDLSVLCVRGQYASHWAGGPLARDFRALIRKIVYPLSARLLHDFPIFRDRTIYLGNIRCLSEIFDVAHLVPVEYESRIREAGTIVNNNPTISQHLIKQLFNWVSRARDSSRKNGTLGIKRTLALPWDGEDYKFLEEKLANVSSKAVRT